MARKDLIQVRRDTAANWVSVNPTLDAGEIGLESDTNLFKIGTGSTEWIFLSYANDKPGLVLVKTQTIGSSVSSVTVTNAFSSAYDQYLITVSGGSCSANSALAITIGPVSNSNHWYNATYYHFADGGYPSSLGIAGSSNIAFVGSANTTSLSASINVNNPFLTSQTFVSGTFAILTIPPSPYDASGTFNGFVSTTLSYTGFTISPMVGFISGGTIRVYGYRK